MREVSVQQEGQYLDACLSARIRLDKAPVPAPYLGAQPPTLQWLPLCVPRFVSGLGERSRLGSPHHWRTANT